MAEPKLTKGTFYVRERGLLYTFMFNPSDIDDTKATTFPNETPAGASHTIYNYASGGEQLISFMLYLDGDRGRSDRRPRYPSNVPSTQGNAGAPNAPVTDLNTGTGIPLSVADELGLLRSLLYPSQYGKTPREVYPYTVIFSFGDYFKPTPCVIKKADIKSSFFTPGLGPIRATVQMQLGIIKPAYQTAAEFYASPGEAREAANAAASAMQAGLGQAVLSAAAGSVFGSLGGLAGGLLGSPGSLNAVSTLIGRRLPMAILPDSRNNLTDVLQEVSAVTGLTEGPAYLEIRERAVPNFNTDQVVQVTEHTRSWPVIATLTMGDPRHWWVIADLSGVVDPFELAIDDKLVVPPQDRFYFQILKRTDL